MKKAQIKAPTVSQGERSVCLLVIKTERDCEVFAEQGIQQPVLLGQHVFLGTVGSFVDPSHLQT
jgi:hypothetical protein